MSDAPDGLSRETLERLVSRALELDEHRTERVSLAKGREIARELGISQVAWEAALAELPERRSSLARAGGAINGRLRALLTAGVGVAAGALGAWLSNAFAGEFDVVFGVLIVVAGLVLWSRTREESEGVAQSRLDVWWLAVPVGMLAVFGELRTDPLLFAAFARWGTAALTARLPRLLRFLREAEPATSKSTA